LRKTQANPIDLDWLSSAQPFISFVDLARLSLIISHVLSLKLGSTQEKKFLLVAQLSSSQFQKLSKNDKFQKRHRVSF
jgi:hypothetical protein